jgi:hypothetical protein
MESLLREVVFSVGGEEYRWEDVVLAARCWGDWDRLRAKTAEGIACLRKLEAEEVSLTDEEVESAADEFRYARDMVSAEDMEVWLARWGLTAEAWMDYIRSSLLREKLSSETSEPISQDPPSPEEIDRRILAEAVCSGELDRLARHLAGLAALDAREMESASESGAPREADRRKENRLEDLEASFRRVRDKAVTPEAIQSQIRSCQTEWTRLDCKHISFPREEMAREAVLCIREDGTRITLVAGEAQSVVRREEIYVENLEPELRDRFLGARPGDLLGPLSSGGEFHLYLVLDKVLPSGTDAAIVARAQDAIVNGLVERETNDRVKWHGRS